MASDPDDVNGQAMMALTPAEAQVLVAAVGEPATPNAERGAGPATYHPMHAPHGVRPGAPAKPVPAPWRVGSTLLVLVACTLIGGAIAVEQGHLRLNAALIWVRRRAKARFAPGAPPLSRRAPRVWFASGSRLRRFGTLGSRWP